MKEIEYIDITRYKESKKKKTIFGKKSLAIPKKGIQKLKEIYNNNKKVAKEYVIEQKPEQSEPNYHKYAERQKEMENEGLGPFKTAIITSSKAINKDNDIDYQKRRERALEESKLLKEEIAKVLEEIQSRKQPRK